MDIGNAADRLEQARHSLSGLRPFSQEDEGLTEEEAWAIAAEVDRRLLRRGHQRTGYKLGWTSAACLWPFGAMAAGCRAVLARSGWVPAKVPQGLSA